MAVRRFEDKDHAALYLQYRPTYPDVVYETIIKFYEEGKGLTCNYDVAVDVGCGSGQGTRPLAKRFQKVIGTDISAEQISTAKTEDKLNIEFRLGKGEDLSCFTDNSVDLVTVAQAVHWFDRESFFEAVSRVLKPGGVIAVYGYGLAQIDNSEGQKLFNQFYYDVLGPYRDKRNRHVHNMYQDIRLPFPGWERLIGDDLVIRRTLSVDAYIGYLSTSSSWRKYLADHPMSDHLQQMRQRLYGLYQTQTGSIDPVINLTFPLVLLIGRKL